MDSLSRSGLGSGFRLGVSEAWRAARSCCGGQQRRSALAGNREGLQKLLDCVATPAFGAGIRGYVSTCEWCYMAHETGASARQLRASAQKRLRISREVPFQKCECSWCERLAVPIFLDKYQRDSKGIREKSHALCRFYRPGCWYGWRTCEQCGEMLQVGESLETTKSRLGCDVFTTICSDCYDTNKHDDEQCIILGYKCTHGYSGGEPCILCNGRSYDGASCSSFRR